MVQAHNKKLFVSLKWRGFLTHASQGGGQLQPVGFEEKVAWLKKNQ